MPTLPDWAVQVLQSGRLSRYMLGVLVLMLALALVPVIG